VPEVWIPGVAGPLDDLVTRIHLRIQDFVDRHGRQARVELELRDGSAAPVRSISPEPGSGFFTACAQADDGGEEEWIVPVAAVTRITLRVAEEEEPFGFTLPEA
jgi:hypothetical protein